MSWMQTYSGNVLEYYSDDISQININDIAKHLSKICRFNGACREFYSVAQHCVLVSEDLKYLGYDIEHQFYGLLHDAAEAYIGDIIRPFKNESMSKFENELLLRIIRALELPEDKYLLHKEAIKYSDNRLLMAEKQQLMAIPQKNGNLNVNLPLLL
jgi:uncharacterized protein